MTKLQAGVVRMRKHLPWRQEGRVFAEQSCRLPWLRGCSPEHLIQAVFGVGLPRLQRHQTDLSARSFFIGIHRGAGGEGATCQCRRCRFHSSVGKIPWRRKWQPTVVFMPGKFHGGEPGGLQSTGSQRVGHNRVTEHTHIAYLQGCVVPHVQQSESAVHIATLFQIPFPQQALQRIEETPLCYTVGSYQLSILYISVYMPTPISKFIPPYIFVFYICGSFSILYIGSCVPFFIDSTYK